MKIPKESQTVRAVGESRSLLTRRAWLFRSATGVAVLAGGCIKEIEQLPPLRMPLSIVGRVLRPPSRRIEKNQSNTVQEKFINSSKNIINKAKGFGQEVPAFMIFQLLNWILKNDPNLTEEKQIETINSQIVLLKTKYEPLSDELTELQEIIPKLRKEILKPPHKEAGKLNPGELLLNNNVVNAIRSFAMNAQMASNEALDFILIFLVETELPKINQAINEAVTKAKENNPANADRIDMFSLKLKEKINLYLEGKKSIKN